MKMFARPFMISRAAIAAASPTRFRQQLLNTSLLNGRSRYFMSAVSDFFGPKLHVEELPLISPAQDFIAHHVKSMRVHSDNAYGGGSSCTIENNGAAGGLRFAGSLVFTEEHAEATKAKSGFCALRIIYNKPIDLRDYQGLKIVMKCETDTQMILNMNCSTYVEDEVYQLHMDIAGSSNWKTLYAPFAKFKVTHRGHVKEDDRENDSLQLEGMGILINKCPEKVFSIDVKSINAMDELPDSAIHLPSVSI